MSLVGLLQPDSMQIPGQLAAAGDDEKADAVAIEASQLMDCQNMQELAEQQVTVALDGWRTRTVQKTQPNDSGWSMHLELMHWWCVAEPENGNRTQTTSTN